MNNSKLIIFLKSLSITEMRDFGRFINAHSGKSAKEVNDFFNYLKKYHPEFPEKKIEKEKVALKIFAKNDANKQKKVVNIMYKLGQLLENFLIQDELKIRQKEQDFLLLQSLKKRKLDKYFFKKIEQVEEEWNNLQEQGIEHLHDIYRLKKMRLNHPNFSKENKVSLESKSLIHCIEQYYFVTKCYWTLSNYNTEKYIDREKERTQAIFPINDILEFIEQDDFTPLPQLKIFTQMLVAFQNKELEDYAILRDECRVHFEQYSKNEKNDLITFLTQICYDNYRKGKDNALQDLFELKKFAVEKEIVLEDGYIATDLFHNIVNIACAANQLEWAEGFVARFAACLHEEERLDTINLCSAILYLKKKEYERVLQKLAQLKFQNVFYGVQARAIQLQAYYELDDYEEMFFNLTKSFSIFLYRNQALAQNQKKSFSNFILFAKKLQKKKNEYRPNWRELLKEISDCKEVVYKSWLLEKAQKQ